MPNYPTNNNDPTITISNLTDYRGQVTNTVGSVATNPGGGLLTNPWRTLEDFYTASNSAAANECNNFQTAYNDGTFSTIEKSFFTKDKQLKILRATRLARRLSRELKILTALLIQENIDDFTALPNAPQNKYPSGYNDFS